MAPEPEVRQRFGKAGQRGMEKVVAQHAVGDQRRGEIREDGRQHPGWIGDVRVDGEAFGRQAGIPAGSRVLPHCRSHDRECAPVAGRDQAAVGAVAQPTQGGSADVGRLEAGRQLRSYLAGSSMLARHQRTSALQGRVVQIVDHQHQRRPPLTAGSYQAGTVTACWPDPDPDGCVCRNLVSTLPR